MNSGLPEIQEAGRDIEAIYKILLNHYGPRGWWPLTELKAEGRDGYHPGNYLFPKNSNQIYEIGLGAILTQNTNWKQAEKALGNLKEETSLIPEKVLKAELDRLKNMIKPSGFFNVKAEKIILFTKFFFGLAGKTPSREELISVRGIGDETADSILLYGYKTPVFVIDNYTIRIMKRLFDIKGKISYKGIQDIFHNIYSNKLSREKIVVFSEYHALFVLHAKEHCRKKPLCNGCILREHCLY